MESMKSPVMVLAAFLPELATKKYRTIEPEKTKGGWASHATPPFHTLLIFQTLLVTRLIMIINKRE